MITVSVTAVAVGATGVLFLAWLLALQVFVVPIVALAYVVSRQTITAVVLARAGAGLAVSVVGYTAVAVLLGLLLSP